MDWHQSNHQPKRRPYPNIGLANWGCKQRTSQVCIYFMGFYFELVLCLTVAYQDKDSSFAYWLDSLTTLCVQIITQMLLLVYLVKKSPCIVQCWNRLLASLFSTNQLNIHQVHGLLHLLGFDHELGKEAEEEMESEEEQILNTLEWKRKRVSRSAYHFCIDMLHSDNFDGWSPLHISFVCFFFK